MATKTPAEVLRDKAVQEFWLRGDLTYKLRPDGQTVIHNFINQVLTADKAIGVDFSHIILNCHRRLGKSFELLLLLVMRCLQFPNQQCKYGAPTYLQVRDIVRPNLSTLLEDCPKELKPRRAGNEYFFKNPRWGDPDAESLLKLVGCNVGRGDRLRGQAADAIALDETREFENLQYTIGSVIVPQFAGRPDAWLIQASTPPKSMSHPFVQVYINRAKEAGKYLCIKGSENKDFGERDKRIILEEVGGEDSAHYQREIECALISDEEALIVPEFTGHYSTICVPRYERPTHFWPYVTMDSGWTDNSAILFGYVDFLAKLLIIESSIWVNYKSTGEIAALIRAEEKRLYPQKLLEKMGKQFCVIRHGDLTNQQLDDLRRDHGMLFRPVEKYDRDAAIANFRTGVQEGKLRILINHQNAPLLHQLEHGIWNERRTDFERETADKMLGHCDALMALIYKWRMVRSWKRNPFPDQKWDPKVQWIDFTQVQKNKNNIKDAFDAGS